MFNTIKWIIVAIVILGFLALFIWGENIPPGSAIAGIAAFIAAIKSKLFENESLKERISEIRGEHQVKREKWHKLKQDYDSKYEQLKTKMDSLDNRTEILKQKIDSTSSPSHTPPKRSEQEILDYLDKI